MGAYAASDPQMVANNQLVWVLHIELTETWRPSYLSQSTSPTGYTDFSRYA